ncbi:MAG: glutaredoxin 2 [Halopseudomonas sp.]|uniref:glutaredoxin 2 n=1 Tax=Halopseudomonas sp. TaxID=2901191 RepID=UPI0030013A6B
MKLYYYDHCPFSARVRMLLNLKEIKVKTVVLPADDEQTITRLLGQHQIPVLIRQDDTPMADSMGIVKYLDYLDGKPIVRKPDTAELQKWIEELVPNLQYLGYPRWTRIGLEEFASPSAYEHFLRKKTASIGDFNEALADTHNTACDVNRNLAQLQHIIDLTSHRSALRWDDIALFPMLRSLSVVKAVQWPDAVRTYTVCQAKRCRLDTFFDRAC